MPVFCHLHLVCFLAGKSKSAVQGAEGGYVGFDVEAGEKMNATQVKADWMCMVLCSFIYDI